MIPRSIKIENEILVSRTIKIDRELGEYRLRNVETPNKIYLGKCRVWLDRSIYVDLGGV